jgi:hypothetical protein
MQPVIRVAPPAELKVYRCGPAVALVAHAQTRNLIASIKSQMPPNPAIQEADEVTSGEGS